MKTSRPEKPSQPKGLIIINTGNGKGKTTAAIGQAIRACGQGLKVCIIQFIKGKWQTGEAKAINKLPVDIELHTLGTGFTWDAASREEVTEAARQAWDFAKDKILSDDFDLVVLDELTYLIGYAILTEQDVLDVLSSKPEKLHIVITGRDATAGLIDHADLVTEMREIKHPYKQGISARKGIEF